MAESAVKNIKLVLSKCAETGQDPHRALYEWRNLPRSNGFSPAQLLFGRRQYTYVPSMPAHFAFYDVQEAAAARDKTHAVETIYHGQPQYRSTPSMRGQARPRPRPRLLRELEELLLPLCPRPSERSWIASRQRTTPPANSNN